MREIFLMWIAAMFGALVGWVAHARIKRDDYGEVFGLGLSVGPVDPRAMRQTPGTASEPSEAMPSDENTYVGTAAPSGFSPQARQAWFEGYRNERHAISRDPLTQAKRDRADEIIARAVQADWDTPAEAFRPDRLFSRDFEKLGFKDLTAKPER